MPSMPRRLARKYVFPRAAQRGRSGAGERRDVSGPGSPTKTRAGRALGDPLLTALREGRSLTAGLVAEVRDLIGADDITGATAVAAARPRIRAPGRW